MPVCRNLMPVVDPAAIQVAKARLRTKTYMTASRLSYQTPKKPCRHKKEGRLPAQPNVFPERKVRFRPECYLSSLQSMCQAFPLTGSAFTAGLP